MNKELGIGSRCFWKGNKFEIVGNTNKSSWVLYNAGGTGFDVPRAEVEPLITDVFSIGDLIRSNHTFEGRVVAFDEERNEVICIGLNQRAAKEGYCDRVRWAYKLREVRSGQVLKFKIGQLYYINTEHEVALLVRAMEHPFHKGRVFLFRVHGGTYVTEVPEEIAAADLEYRYKITMAQGATGV